MSRVLVMGYELPSMAEGTIEARSYRTWQFVQPLLENGHTICFIASHTRNESDVAQNLGASLAYHRLNLQQRGWLSKANAICNNFKPDATLAVMFNNGLRATRLSCKGPLWIDLYGDRITEAQIASHTRQSNRGMKMAFEYLNLILQHADKYSTCSTPQKYELIGQLSTAGRLNRHTLGYEFVHAVLPGAPSGQVEIKPEIKLRGNQVPEDAFIVLWCGGYNVWTDVDTLFRALSRAMEEDPRIHYVSAGAGVKLANNNSYERLLEMIAKSPHCDRFHMLGWQPSNVVPGLYQQADVGINLDAFHYETQIGTRTRLVEMMHHGLPVITTLGCELSDLIKDHELGMTFNIGDDAAFAEQILALAKDNGLQKKLARQAHKYTNEELSFQKTTEPFQEWVKEPKFAPDHNIQQSRFDIRELEYGIRGAARSWLWKIWALERGD